MCINSIFIYINPLDGNEIVKKDNQEFNQSVNGHFDLSLRSGKINPFLNYSIDDSCDECPYYPYGKTCNTMLYIDVMKFLPPITPDDCNTCKYPNICENCARAIEDR